MIYRYNIKKNEDGFFVATFPDMTNVTTFDFTVQKAKKMAKEALEGALIVSLEHSLEIPEPQSCGKYEVEVDPRLAALVKERWKQERKVRKAFAKSLKKKSISL